MGITLILLGLFIPLISLPFASGYNPEAGLVLNIQRMQLPLLEEKRKPTFKPTTVIDLSAISVEVPLGKEKTVVEFPANMPQEEMEDILKAQFLLGKEVPPGQYPNRIVFSGYETIRKQFVIPYRYPIAVAIILLFAGVIVIVHWGLKDQRS